MSVGTVTEGTIPFDLPRDEAQAIRVTLRRIMFASIPSHLARRWPIFFGAVAAGFAALLVSPELALAQFITHLLGPIVDSGDGKMQTRMTNRLSTVGALISQLPGRKA